MHNKYYIITVLSIVLGIWTRGVHGPDKTELSLLMLPGKIINKVLNSSTHIIINMFCNYRKLLEVETLKLLLALLYPIM